MKGNWGKKDKLEEDREYWRHGNGSIESQRRAFWPDAYPGAPDIPERASAFPGLLIEVAPARHGSVSARARQRYAIEALRSKDHVAAGLLAIFLGMFGIHKFYLGCNQAGFIMMAVAIIGGMLTFGVAAVFIAAIGIIEGIIYLTKSQTEFEHVYVVNQRDWF